MFQAALRYSASAPVAGTMLDVNANVLAAASGRRERLMTTFGFSDMLSNRPFHLQLYQAVHFYGIFHRQFLNQGLNEA